MGGRGRTRESLTTDDVRSLNVSVLRREGALTHGARTRITWAGGASIGASSQEKSLELDYRISDAGGGVESVRQTILLSCTPCNFGGLRYWFLCPYCSCRCTKLYFVRKRFKCRNCGELVYLSTLVTDIDRLVARQDKIGKRIFENYENGETGKRKKGMHTKTFEREFARWLILEGEFWGYIEKYLVKNDLK